MNENQITEALQTALNNGHITVTFIDVGSIIGATAGLLLSIAMVLVPYLIYKNHKKSK